MNGVPRKQSELSSQLYLDLALVNGVGNYKLFAPFSR